MGNEDAILETLGDIAGLLREIRDRLPVALAVQHIRETVAAEIHDENWCGPMCWTSGVAGTCHLPRGHSGSHRFDPVMANKDAILEIPALLRGAYLDGGGSREIDPTPRAELEAQSEAEIKVASACEMCGRAPCEGCNKCCGHYGRDPEDGSCLGCG